MGWIGKELNLSGNKGIGVIWKPGEEAELDSPLAWGDGQSHCGTRGKV